MVRRQIYIGESKGENAMGNNIRIEAINGHYEVYVNGKFYCSCDSYGEVNEELADLD